MKLGLLNKKCNLKWEQDGLEEKDMSKMEEPVLILLFKMVFNIMVVLKLKIQMENWVKNGAILLKKQLVIKVNGIYVSLSWITTR